MVKTILGIDPGTTITGYGVIKSFSNKHEAIDFGYVQPNQKFEIQKKQLIIFNKITEVLEKHSPDEVSIESQFVYKNVNSTLKLNMTKAIITLACSIKNISVFEYTPKKIKLSVVGNGGATKQQVNYMVKMLLNLKVLPLKEDVSDALAIAICHAHNGGNKCLNI